MWLAIIASRASWARSSRKLPGQKYEPGSFLLGLSKLGLATASPKNGTGSCQWPRVILVHPWQTTWLVLSTSLCKKTGTYVPVLNDERLVLKYQSWIKEDWYLSTSLDKSTGTYVPVANYDWYISTSRNLRNTGTMYQSLRQKAGT